MKKLLILTNLAWGLAFGAFILKSCSPQTEDSTKGNETAQPTTKEGDIVLNYLEKDFKTLPLETAKLLASNYKERLQLVYEKEKIQDARSVWFSLEEIEQFAWIIRYYSEAAKLNISSKDLGINIYYAKYPNANIMKSNTVFSDVSSEYALRHTVFMVPTYKMDGKNVDFDPRANYDGAIKKGWKNVMPLFRKDDKDTTKTVPFSLVPLDQSTILNHGGLCPPCL